MTVACVYGVVLIGAAAISATAAAQQQQQQSGPSIELHMPDLSMPDAISDVDYSVLWDTGKWHINGIGSAPSQAPTIHIAPTPVLELPDIRLSEQILPDGGLDLSGLSDLANLSVDINIDINLAGLDASMDALSMHMDQLDLAMDGLDVAMDRLDLAMDGLDDSMQALAATMASMAASGHGADWATAPDHSETLVVRPADLAAPTGILPVDADRLCAVSSLLCQASGNEAGTGPTSTDVSITTAYAASAPMPPDPDDPDFGRTDGSEANDTGEAIGHVRPAVSDAKLENYVEQLYKHQGREGVVGDGTTMDALPGEVEAGAGRHIQKSQDIVRGLNKWIRRRGHNASESDLQNAISMRDELQSLLGPYKVG